jgi:hypothetical protein
MKVIKLSGRETAVLRAIETEGNTGAEIQKRTQISAEDLTDILNGMSDVGYVEAYKPNTNLPLMDPVKHTEVLELRFEVNPSYAQELKKAIAHR